MMRPAHITALALGLVLALAGADVVLAQQRAAPAAPPAPPAAQPARSQPAQPGRSGPLGNLGQNSKDPIKIDADRLDVFEKESRAVFAGNVVAVQGETTMRCTTLTVFYEQGAGQRAGGRQGEGAIKKIDCAGPVTVVSKTQVATGNSAIFDRAANKVSLIGNATSSDGGNVIQGERIVYDMNTGQAAVESEGGRVKALIVPGSNPEARPGGPQPASPRPRPAQN